MARPLLTALTLIWLVLAPTSRTSAAADSHPIDPPSVAVHPATTPIVRPVTHLVTPKPSKPEPKALSWQQLNAQQKQLLAALAPQWDRQPDRLRNGLVKVANKYPKMKPDEQERVRRRISRWASLTPEQREAARHRFQQIKKQPPEKQKEVKKKWERYRAEQKPPAPIAPSVNSVLQAPAAQPAADYDTE